MSISCELLAEGAVLPPDSGRFTPNAAHNMFDITWTGNFSGLKFLDDTLSFRTCISGLPPSVCGAGS